MRINSINTDNPSTLEQSLNQLVNFYKNQVVWRENRWEYLQNFKNLILSIPNVSTFMTEDKDIWYLFQLYKYLQNASLTREELIASLMHNLCFDYSRFVLDLPEWFHLYRSKRCHPEAANQMHIWWQTHNDRSTEYIVCAFNFFFVVRENKIPDIRINLMQWWLHSGKPGWDYANNKFYGEKQWKRITHGIFGRLNRWLNWDWKVYFINKLQEFVGTTYNLVWELPPKYSIRGGGESEVYVQYLFMYLEAYIKAWIPLDHIDQSTVNGWFQELLQPIIKRLASHDRAWQIMMVKLLRIKYRIFLDTFLPTIAEEDQQKDQKIRKALIEIFSFENK